MNVTSAVNSHARPLGVEKCRLVVPCLPQSTSNTYHLNGKSVFGRRWGCGPKFFDHHHLISFSAMTNQPTNRSSSSSRREFSALHARNRTWRALHCQSLKHKLKKTAYKCLLSSSDYGHKTSKNPDLFHDLILKHYSETVTSRYQERCLLYTYWDCNTNVQYQWKL